MASTILCMTFDCANPEAFADFWGAALGYERMDAGNRFHLDLQCENMDAEAARLIELGATVLWVHHGVRQSWTTLADPEGNEFCVG